MLDFTCHFLPTVEFWSLHPLPGSGWTGPVPGGQNGSAGKLLLPDAAGLAGAARCFPDAFPRDRLCSSPGLWHTAGLSRGGGDSGDLAPLRSFWWSKGLWSPQVWPGTERCSGWRDSCCGFCPADLACGQQRESPHAIASAHVFMHSVLLLVSQSVCVFGVAPRGDVPWWARCGRLARPSAWCCLAQEGAHLVCSACLQPPGR